MPRASSDTRHATSKVPSNRTSDPSRKRKRQSEHNYVGDNQNTSCSSNTRDKTLEIEDLEAFVREFKRSENTTLSLRNSLNDNLENRLVESYKREEEKDKQIDTLRAQRDLHKTRAGKATSALLRAQAETETLATEKIEMENEISLLRGEKETLKSEVEESRGAEELRQENEALKADKESLTTEKDGLKTRIDSLEKEVNDSRAKFQQYKRRVIEVSSTDL